MKELKILTGPSGSGITSCKFVFEELGYYIVENAPTSSVEAVLEAFNQPPVGINKFCLIVPIGVAQRVLDIARQHPEFKTELVLLTCDPNEIRKRYRLSRHAHPKTVGRKLSLDQAIDLDVKEATSLFSEADIYIDTTALGIKFLRINLYNKLTGSSGENITSIYFISFGYKNGIPTDMDMIFDVRTIPNPYWVDELKVLNGADQAVIDYMQSFPETQQVLDNIVNYLQFHLAQVQKRGRPIYNIGIACSGGQHRSTYVANYLATYFSKKYKTQAIHRDSPALNEEE